MTKIPGNRPPDGPFFPPMPSNNNDKAIWEHLSNAIAKNVDSVLSGKASSRDIDEPPIDNKGIKGFLDGPSGSLVASIMAIIKIEMQLLTFMGQKSIEQTKAMTASAISAANSTQAAAMADAYALLAQSIGSVVGGVVSMGSSAAQMSTLLGKGPFKMADADEYKTMLDDRKKLTKYQNEVGTPTGVELGGQGTTETQFRASEEAAGRRIDPATPLNAAQRAELTRIQTEEFRARSGIPPGRNLTPQEEAQFERAQRIATLVKERRDSLVTNGSFTTEEPTNINPPLTEAEGTITEQAIKTAVAEDAVRIKDRLKTQLKDLGTKIRESEENRNNKMGVWKGALDAAGKTIEGACGITAATFKVSGAEAQKAKALSELIQNLTMSNAKTFTDQLQTITNQVSQMLQQLQEQIRGQR